MGRKKVGDREGMRWGKRLGRYRHGNGGEGMGG